MKKQNLLHEFFNSKSDASNLEASEQERLEKDFQEWYNKKMTDINIQKDKIKTQSNNK